MHPRLACLAALLAATLLTAPAAAQAPIGRLSEATGPVQARDDARAWSALPRGSALREGQSLRTLPRSQAELDLGPNRIGLDPDTVLRIDSAHPAAPAFALNQGRAMFLLRSLRPGQEARITTPNATIALIQPGLYVVDAGADGRPLTIGVTRGMAQAVGAGISLMVSAGQTGVIGGPETRPASLRAGVAEGFLADDPDMPPLPQVVRPAMPAPSPGNAGYAAPPEIVQLPGGDALLRDGNWVATPNYGPVWYPPVAPSWSPYSDPWGERTTWGYAPWHYGSWISIGPRWGWRPPPRHYYPYYARGQRPPPLPHDYGRPPPAVAQPNRPSPFWGGPPPRGPERAAIPAAPPAATPAYRGGRPESPPGTPPIVTIPQSAPPPQASPPPPRPDFWGRPSAAPPAAGRPSFAAPPAFAAPRPSSPPMMAAPPPPRPMPAPAPAPARRCGIFGNPC